MATYHVGFERQKERDLGEPDQRSGSMRAVSVDERAAGGGPTRGSTHDKRAIAVYLGGAVVLSILVALAIPVLHPALIGFLLLCVLVVAGWLIIFRRHAAIGSHSHPHVKDLRQELDVTRRRYRRLFSAVPDFICVLDRKHNIIEANDAYRQAFNADKSSLCYEVCKRRTSECPHCVVDATFSDGIPRTEEEILITRDGRRINTLVHTQPIFDEDLNINAVMEVFTDVTEIKRLQRQLALTGRAVAGTAHRIKNILMGLEGGIFIVNDGLESDDRQTIESGWEMVERNVHRVAAIVKDLLFCAKERKPELERDVSPQEILFEVRDLFADRMQDENIEIIADAPEPHHRGIFDPEAIHSLLCNLVANSIDACRFDPSESKNGHRVILRCTQNGDGHTVFEVEDDGEGIPEELTQKVFSEFFSSKGTEGTGIGLLVVQKVAEEHGGTVTFESRPGEGTLFTVTIPPHTHPTPLADSGQLPMAEETPAP